MKWAFIEAAHGAVRHGGRFRAMFDRVTKGGTKDRNRGYIRVARELVKVVTAVWKNGTTYQETPPRRPGSGRSVKARASRHVSSQLAAAPSLRKQMENFFGSTRSGTGQLYHPMVPADKA